MNKLASDIKGISHVCNEVQWSCVARVEYRKISNTIRTHVQYAPQTFTGELWENVSLAVQYAPVLCHLIQTCSLPYIVLLSEVSYSIVHFFHTN